MVEPKTRPLAEKLGALLEILFRQLFAFELREQTRAPQPVQAEAADDAAQEVTKADGEGECWPLHDSSPVRCLGGRVS